MKRYGCLLLICVAAAACAQQKVPPAAVQIKGAVLAAPAPKRDAAAVYGYNEKGDVVLLRSGSNELVCLADNPFEAGFSAACYHRSLEPFMKRGRELRKQGKAGRALFDLREAEVKAGKLQMPAQSATLYVLTATDADWDAAAGTVRNGALRYVVYIPYATAESTGLPLRPEAPAMPWIMDPGTHGAHIMITPPK